MYATFKVVTSMLQVGGVVHPQNYQCAFATISIVYPSEPKNGYLKIHKSSANPEMTDKTAAISLKASVMESLQMRLVLTTLLFFHWMPMDTASHMSCQKVLTM